MSNTTLYRELSDRYGKIEIKDNHDMRVDETIALVNNIDDNRGKAGWYDIVIDSLYLAYKMGYVRAGEADQEG